MKRYYAVEEKFSNIETLHRFTQQQNRDAWVGMKSTRSSQTAAELKKRFATNKRIVRENRNNSAWVNGLPVCMDDAQPVFVWNETTREYDEM